MRNWLRKLVSGAVVGLGLLAAPLVYGASVPSFSGVGGANPINFPAVMADLNTLIALINSTITSQSMAVPATPRNLVDNGNMAVYQRGTGIATCGTNTAPTATAFSADRWTCDVNVASGAGRMQITTTSPPLDAPAWNKIYRTSGALTQPVCTYQSIAADKVVAAQGQSVMLSVSMKDLGGLVTDNGGVVNAYMVTGTVADEGFGPGFGSSPAITPAWTGVASAYGGSTWTITASEARYSAAQPIPIPTTAKEIGIAFCFTPTATGAGTTDGFAFSKVQLEILGPGATGPSAFESVPYAQAFLQAAQYYYQLNEPASGAAVNGFCQATGATANACTLPLPIPMRGVTPVVAIGATGTFKVNIAGTPTTWVTPTAGVCSTAACTITAGNTNTAGQAEQWTGGGGSGIVTVMNDSIE
jgi:hypothetical protein